MEQLRIDKRIKTQKSKILNSVKNGKGVNPNTLIKYDWTADELVLLQSKIRNKRKTNGMAFYLNNRARINKTKILNRVKNGAKINKSTITKYEWTADELDYLNKHLRNKTNKKITEPTPLLVLTIDDVKKIMNNDTNIKESSKITQIQTLSTFMKLFTDVTTFTEVFNKYTDIQIIDIVTAQYPNLSTRLKHINIILKVYDLNKEFSMFLTKPRRDNLHNASFETDQTYRSNRINEKEEDETDYMDDFINIFEKELTLRKTEPSSIDHIMSVIYTIGAYSSQSLESGNLMYVPRIDELVDIKLVKDDKEMTSDTQNYYNYDTGRLVINSLKTDNNSIFKYDHVINPLASKYIKINILRRTPKKRDSLFPFTKQTIELKIRKNVLPNRIYRKAFQNIYHKILNKPLASMSKPMAHTVDTSNKDYLNNKEYTRDEIIENRRRIADVFKRSSTS